MVKGCSPRWVQSNFEAAFERPLHRRSIRGPRATTIWFLNEDRFLFAVADLTLAERGNQGAPYDGGHDMFGFLTTDANAIAAPIHLKALPVILTNPAEVDRGLAAETSDALALQQPLADGALRIVGRGERSHGSVTAA